LTGFDDYVESYSLRMREAFKSRYGYKRRFWFSNYMDDDTRPNYDDSSKPYRSRSGMPMDDCKVAYVYAALRLYGTGTTCFIVPEWIVCRRRYLK